METQRINWYPGHMAKAKRQITEQLKNIDLVIELCDARLPFSSRNPDMIRLAGHRKHLLLMNKSDLADERMNRLWLQSFRESGIRTMMVNGLQMNRKDVLNTIDDLTKDLQEKAQQKGIKRTIRAMVVGVPNVGKSTVINRLKGNKIAVTGDRPGVTRSNQMIRITPYLELMDTPGLLWPRLDDQKAAKRLCYIGTISDEVVDLADLTISLLEELKEKSPRLLQERYHLESLDAGGVELLDAVCRGRGWLLKGNEYDYDRCCRVVLDEFREGKIGRVTLESPEGSRSGAAAGKETGADD